MVEIVRAGETAALITSFSMYASNPRPLVGLSSHSASNVDFPSNESPRRALPGRRRRRVCRIGPRSKLLKKGLCDPQGQGYTLNPEFGWPSLDELLFFVLFTVAEAKT